MLRFPKPPPCHTDMLFLKGAAFGWPQRRSQTDGEAAEAGPPRPLVSNADVKISKGMRAVVRGANGAGKSTLLHALAGRLPLIEGERVEGQGLDVGLFTQDLAQDLDQVSGGGRRRVRVGRAGGAGRLGDDLAVPTV